MGVPLCIWLKSIVPMALVTQPTCLKRVNDDVFGYVNDTLGVLTHALLLIYCGCPLPYGGHDVAKGSTGVESNLVTL